MNASDKNTQPDVIHVVEDDDAVRESLHLLLDSVGYQAKTYRNASEFLDHYSNQMTGCLVLDIRMPGMDGMALQRKLVEMNAILPIIVVTGHGDIAMAVEAMKQGAFDFVQKPYREQELLEKIQLAVAQDHGNRESLEQRNLIESRYDSLTPREQDVLKQIVEGKANKIIADVLSISQRTVEIHRSRVMEKMQANSIAHLVRLYLQLNDET